MTALGKLLALLNLIAGLAMLSWAAGLFLDRPSWYDPVPEAVDKGHTPVTFKGLQAEIATLNATAAVAGQAWGENLEMLKERERFRAHRKAGYAQRIAWAKYGNPNDPVVADGPLKAFYEPNTLDLTVVKADLKVAELKLKTAKDALERAEKAPSPDPKELAPLRAEVERLARDVDELNLTVKFFPLVSTLQDPRVDPGTGLPRGKVVVAVDGTPLLGSEKLLDTLTKDVEKINELDAVIYKLRKGVKELKTDKDFREPDAYTKADEYRQLGAGQLITYTKALELRLGKMRDIRDTVQNELFFLSTYEVNVYETRETVLRREKQLRRRLLSLGVTDP
jgi:hypothetical protein